MTVLPRPPPALGGRSDLKGELGWEGEGSVSRGSGTFHRIGPQSHLQAPEEKRMRPRRLRLSSSTKVRGPLAPARPSKVSSSSHQPDHTQGLRGAPSSCSKTRRLVTGSALSAVAQSRLVVLEYHPEVTGDAGAGHPQPLLGRRSARNPAEVSLWEAGSRHTIGESGAVPPRHEEKAQS